MPFTFRTGKYGKNVDRNVMSEFGLEVTVREQQRRVRHVCGEGEMERCDTCAKNLFSTLEPCVCVTRVRSVQM